MKVYFTDRKCLAFYQQKATPDFWDNHWATSELKKHIYSCTNDGMFIPLVNKYLPRGSKVLEGGCGRGHLVYALKHNGYKAIGIDFAEKTIGAIKSVVPELDVRAGDVRNLSLADSELDGYVSVGVIEHFWEGYEKITLEMGRTVKEGGYLFISFPYMSFLRKFKVLFRQYPFCTVDEKKDDKESFYQFALDDGQVIKDIENSGFRLVEKSTYDGIKGFKDEVEWAKPFLQKVYDGKLHQKFRPIIDKCLKYFAPHVALLVFKKV